MLDLPNATAAMHATITATAEARWAKWSQDKNGSIILRSEEIPAGEKLKIAYMTGDIIAQAAVVEQFIQNGMNDFLLPHKRIRWNTPVNLILKDGEKAEELLFVALDKKGETRIVHGWAEADPHEKLFPEDERNVIQWFDYLDGKPHTVIGWIKSSELLATFA